MLGTAFLTLMIMALFVRKTSLDSLRRGSVLPGFEVMTMKLICLRLVVRTVLVTLVFILCLACLACKNLVIRVRMVLTVLFVWSKELILMVDPCTCNLRRIGLVGSRRVAGTVLCRVSIPIVYTRLLMVICRVFGSSDFASIHGLRALR